METTDQILEKPAPVYPQTDKLPYCNEPKGIERALPGDIDPRRASLIRIISKKWVNGTVLHYCFFDHTQHNSPNAWTGSDGDKDVVRDCFREWKALGIGLQFEEVQDPADAEIRIGFDLTDGSWSYVGRDILEQPLDRRTMNFGWSLTENWYGKETALHETGHALGFPHEHQNPKSGILWDEEAVYQYFAAAPNYWDKQTTYYNVLRKIALQEIEGTNWDPNSIMHYQFPAELIDGPAPYDQQGIFPEPGLSQFDIDEVKKFYPPQEESEFVQLEPFVSQQANILPGQQLDFLIKPGSTRKYTIRTFGESDTVMVLFEELNGTPRYVTADDDGGHNYNSNIETRLYKNSRYILRLRLYYAGLSGKTAVMLW